MSLAPLRRRIPLPEEARPARRVETELVVHLALLGVGKNFVGFLDLLELFLGGLVAGIQVGMIFARELAVGGANVFHRWLCAELREDS